MMVKSSGRKQNSLGNKMSLDWQNNLKNGGQKPKLSTFRGRATILFQDTLKIFLCCYSITISSFE
jgi:hypothetical protein